MGNVTLQNICKYYKGENKCPSEYNNTEGQIWDAERWICSQPNLIGKQHPELDFVSYVASYIGKWNPYEYRDVVKFYLLLFNNKSLSEYITRVYEL